MKLIQNITACAQNIIHTPLQGQQPPHTVTAGSEVAAASSDGASTSCRQMGAGASTGRYTGDQ